LDKSANHGTQSKMKKGVTESTKGRDRKNTEGSSLFV